MWKNAAEGMVRYLKSGSGRKTSKSCSPKKLCDHCLELEGLIFYHPFSDVFKLERGGVLETALTGDTDDISINADHAWNDWIRFNDTVGKQFPEEKNKCTRRCLVPDIDVGLALIAKILKSNS